MESTPAKRFVDVLGRLGYSTQQQIADVLKVKRPTAGTIVRMETEPSFSALTALKNQHPEVNLDWIFSGVGSAFITGEEKPVLAAFPKDPPITAPIVKGPQLSDESEYIKEVKESRRLAQQAAEEWKQEAAFWRDLYLGASEDEPQASGSKKELGNEEAAPLSYTYNRSRVGFTPLFLIDAQIQEYTKAKSTGSAHMWVSQSDSVTEYQVKSA